MLETLRIRNLALVEDLSVEFQPGLNVLTGETGAGKSILVGALGLLLGERADKSMIRAGMDQAEVEAMFSLPPPSPLLPLLHELGIEEDGSDTPTLILRRSIQSNGSGRIQINNQAATLQTLKRIGDRLVDLHGPHEHQSLLSTDHQRDLLDAFGRLAPDRVPCEEHYRRLIEIARQCDELEGDEAALARELDFLAYQVKELEEARLEAGEEQRLQEEHARCVNLQELLETAEALLESLTDGEHSALQVLQAAQRPLERLISRHLDAASWNQELREAIRLLKKLGASIAAAAQRVEADPDRLHQIEERMAIYHKLRRKYPGGPEEWLRQLEAARSRMRMLQNREHRLAELNAERAKVEAQLRTAAAHLHEKRIRTAQLLSEKVQQELRDLGLIQGGFEIRLFPIEPNTTGGDAVEFFFAPNPGEPPRPLRAIASSGEISRVMLALKTALAEHDRIPILVFDEIDANIGGETAVAVGRKLRTLARTHQILAITHMPQVAVYGTAHFAVVKEVREGRTRTRIAHLGRMARSEEIARMLGGRDTTSVVLQHAREMLARAAAEEAPQPRAAGKR